MKRRRFARGDARRRVLRAAARLFSRKGFAATSVGEIASKAQASPSSIYHHFRGGKDDILLAVVDEAADAFVSRTVEVVNAATTPAAKADALFREAQHQMEHTPDALRLLMQMSLERAGDSADVRSRIQGIFGRYREVIANQLGAAVPDRAGTVARKMGTIMLATLQGIFLQWQLDPDAIDLDEVFDQLRATARTQLATS
jgi:TetR/AcrR family transcriptional repressor of lmrAB and yxaGH operons